MKNLKNLAIVSLMIGLGGCGIGRSSDSDISATDVGIIKALADIAPKPAAKVAKVMVDDKAGYLLTSETKLRDALAGTGLRVSRDDNDLRVTMPSNLAFQSEKSDLSGEAQGVVAKIADVLRDQSALNVKVEGHTDSYGKEEFNLVLSKKRADNVAKELSANGVVLARIDAVGLGESAPIAKNNTKIGRQLNRRVVILLTL